jgi:NADH-quinone oxidoreductase subunit C
MSQTITRLKDAVASHFGDRIVSVNVDVDELTIEVTPVNLLDVCRELRDEDDFQFEILIDACGVDYLGFGIDEWETSETTGSGYSRGVDSATAGRLRSLERDLSVETPSNGQRFAAVYHLLSIANNQRIRIRCFAPDDELPVIPSVINIWNCANWYEREAFDLYGIIFEGHPDLRRLLTDYGFLGHPFRKDFPLSGNVEMRYDPERQRVVYEPVTIEPRVLVPRVIRPTERPASSDDVGDDEEAVQAEKD